MVAAPGTTPMSGHEHEIDEGRLELLERDDLLRTLAAALDGAAAGRGRLILLAGEAGAGKTALVRAFTAGRPDAHILHGACERLFTPRALGPFLDIAESAGRELADVAERGGASAHEFVVALLAQLRRHVPTVLVVEDLHWADDGTLDVLKLLARRIEPLPALVLATFRDDQLGAGAPLRMVLGELAGTPAVERHRLPRLSRTAVRRLAGSDAAAAQVYELTAGNPFFVTEAIAAGSGEVPATARDAVLARAAPLSPPGRRLLEAAAVVPAGSSSGCSRRSPRRTCRSSRNASPRACFAPPMRRSNSAMSSPASRSRRRSRPIAGSSSTAPSSRR